MSSGSPAKDVDDKGHVGSPKLDPAAPPPNEDVENQTSVGGGGGGGGGSGPGVAGILRRWKREDLLRRASLALRGLALLFSLLSFIIMASNKHGDWKNFDRYEEFRYVLAITILSTLYNGGQSLVKIHELSTGKDLFPKRNSALFDFVGDQIASYLLLSSASSAVPRLNGFRESQDNIFTDSLASSISMAFLAFFTLALSAVISGYKLSNNSYI